MKKVFHCCIYLNLILAKNLIFLEDILKVVNKVSSVQLLKIFFNKT